MPKLCCLKMGSKFSKTPRVAEIRWPKLGRAKVPSFLGCRNWAGNAFGSIGIITVFVHFRHFDMVRCMYIVLVSIAILYYCSMLLNAR